MTFKSLFLALVVLYFEVMSCQQLLNPRYNQQWQNNLASTECVWNVDLQSQFSKATLYIESPFRMTASNLCTVEDADYNL
jgi:hypothetical protein